MWVGNLMKCLSYVKWSVCLLLLIRFLKFQTLRISGKIFTVYNSCKHFTHINFTYNNSMDIIILFLYLEPKSAFHELLFTEHAI